MTVDEFSNRVAVVTGAESGIGRAIAVRLAERGAAVFVGDLERRPENDERFRQLRVDRRECDVRREGDVRELIARAAAESGHIDVLVNNAGVAVNKPVTEVSEDEWNWCFDTNVKGAFFGCKHAIPLMQPAGGSIINISSNAGLLPRWHDPVYSISKASLVALTRTLALAHGVDRIRINAICPGPVAATGLMDENLAHAADPSAAAERFIAASPLARAHQRMITPDEVACAAIYLASDAALMVTGTAIAIDGGKSLGVPPP